MNQKAKKQKTIQNADRGSESSWDSFGQAESSKAQQSDPGRFRTSCRTNQEMVWLFFFQIWTNSTQEALMSEDDWRMIEGCALAQDDDHNAIAQNECKRAFTDLLFWAFWIVLRSKSHEAQFWRIKRDLYKRARRKRYHRTKKIDYAHFRFNRSIWKWWMRPKGATK